MAAVDKEDIKKENYRKKEYLRGYRKHRRRIKRIEAELEEIREMKISPSMNNDGMPHGSSQSDLSDYAAKLDVLEDELQEEGIEQVKAYKDIQSRIEELEDKNERDVLFYRYTKGLNWWEIANEMGYTERWVYKIHGKALAHLKIPKEFIVIQ